MAARAVACDRPATPDEDGDVGGKGAAEEQGAGGAAEIGFDRKRRQRM